MVLEVAVILDGDLEVVPYVVVVTEPSYNHIPTYDDPLLTDNDPPCCGKFIAYVKPGEVNVTPVGDVP